MISYENNCPNNCLLRSCVALRRIPGRINFIKIMRKDITLKVRTNFCKSAFQFQEEHKRFFSILFVYNNDQQEKNDLLERAIFSICLYEYSERKYDFDEVQEPLLRPLIVVIASYVIVDCDCMNKGNFPPDSTFWLVSCGQFG